MARKQFLSDYEAERLLAHFNLSKDNLDPKPPLEVDQQGSYELIALWILRNHYNKDIGNRG